MNGDAYCMQCGESPESATHWFSSDGHAFIKAPEGSRWVFKQGTCKKFLVLTGALASDTGERDS
jgi:hypothetical protein